MRLSTHARGLTLLEMAVALAIAAIVFALGVPAFGGFLSEQQVQDRAEALLHALDVARSEAIKRGGRVDVCPGRGGCTAGAMPWEGGWVVVPDASRGDDAAVVVRERTSMAGITIRGNRPVADYVSYTGAGRARRFEGGLQMGTFTICRTGQRARKVILANSGRARIEIASDRCP